MKISERTFRGGTLWLAESTCWASPKASTFSARQRSAKIVIPKEARTLFGVQPGDTLLILGDEQMGIIVTKPEVIENAAMKIFEEMEREPK